MKTFAAILSTVICVGVTFGCSSPSSPSNAGGGTPTEPQGPPVSPITGAVGIHNSTYATEIVDITVGGNVTWTNFGPSRHTTVSDTGLWSSGPLLPPDLAGDPFGDPHGDGDSVSGETFTWIFTEAGIYPYHCELHPDKRGTIYVSLDLIPGGGSGKG